MTMAASLGIVASVGIATRGPNSFESLVVEMAEDNRWGALRIQGGLKHIGHIVSHQTVLNVLKRRGLYPSPNRVADDSWAKFLRVHLAVTVATEFSHARGDYRQRIRHLLHLILYTARYATCSYSRYNAILKSKLDASVGAEFNWS